MPKKRPEDPPKGSPAWMATFSDLMNLLLCFFVLLFSMSTVDADKFQQVIASLQSSVSILPAGGASIGDGEMISAGVRQLEFMDSYYNEVANSEKMAEEIQKALDASELGSKVDVDFNAEYVQLNLNGAILFDSGHADLVSGAIPIVDKIGKVLEQYDANVIEIEGHTDNVPIRSNGKFESNEILSVYRALAVAERLRDHTSLDPKYIKFAGRGDYVPIADNSTPEGRARNRRVEIKVYNSYNSKVD